MICKLFVSGYTSFISSCSKSRLSREKQSKNRSNGLALMFHVITKLLSEVNDDKIKGLEIVIRLAGKTFNDGCSMAMSSDQPFTLDFFIGWEGDQTGAKKFSKNFSISMQWLKI